MVVFNDSYKEVWFVVNKSLKRFGEVIINFEIYSLVDVFFKVFSDVIKYIDIVFDVFIKVQFVYYFDVFLLVFVSCILECGLVDCFNIKCKVVQVIGSLVYFIECKDLVFYLFVFVVGFKFVIVDFVFIICVIVFCVFGLFVEKLGEDVLLDFIFGFMQMFKFDIGVGDRFGFVQVFSEVFVGFGILRLEEILFIIL